MNKKIRYLNFVKQSIRDNTYKVPPPKWTNGMIRYRVGGVLTLTTTSISNLDETILTGRCQVEGKLIMESLYRRLNKYYGIMSMKEFSYVMQGFWEWIVLEKDNIRMYGVQKEK